ncbi:hypothetical protein AHAS_Ahas13G0324800 [Arachis hypogaea]
MYGGNFTEKLLSKDTSSIEGRTCKVVSLQRLSVHTSVRKSRTYKTEVAYRAAELRVRLYVLHDHPFQNLINTPFFEPNAPYEFPLSWLHLDAPHHLFPNGPRYPHPVQPEDQIVPLPNPVEQHVLERNVPLEPVSLPSSSA